MGAHSSARSPSSCRCGYGGRNRGRGRAVGRELAQVLSPQHSVPGQFPLWGVGFARAPGSSLRKERYLFLNKHFKTNDVASLKNLFFKIEVYRPLSTTAE